MLPGTRTEFAKVHAQLLRVRSGGDGGLLADSQRFTSHGGSGAGGPLRVRVRRSPLTRPKPAILGGGRPWKKVKECYVWVFHLLAVTHVVVVIWLILPVVICLSQRLSHACLSISIIR